MDDFSYKNKDFLLKITSRKSFKITILENGKIIDAYAFISKIPPPLSKELFQFSAMKDLLFLELNPQMDFNKFSKYIGLTIQDPFFIFLRVLKKYNILSYSGVQEVNELMREFLKTPPPNFSKNKEKIIINALKKQPEKIIPEPKRAKIRNLYFCKKSKLPNARKKKTRISRSLK